MSLCGKDPVVTRSQKTLEGNAVIKAIFLQIYDISVAHSAMFFHVLATRDVLNHFTGLEHWEGSWINSFISSDSPWSVSPEAC